MKQMITFKRIQRKRTKGYRTPENTVNVARPSKWGNPFKIEGIVTTNWTPEKEKESTERLQTQRKEAVSKFQDMLINPDSHEVSPEIRERFLWMHRHLSDLEGKNLACYCKIGEECHADVLLRLANLSPY